MIQNTLINQYNNPLEKEILKLFHESALPLHFNHKGNKQFQNLQRITLIILFKRSRKSIRDFLKEIGESKWISWLSLRKIPSKSTFHNWLKLFSMKMIRKLFSQLKPKNSKLTAIDGTGFDSFHRSRHYEKRVGSNKTPYAKVDLFVDVETQEVIDFSLVTKHQHDIIAAKQFVKRNDLSGFEILCDGGYDCEDFHESVFEKGGRSYAPVRKKDKRSLKRLPKGRFRRKCLELPEFMGQRSIIECINAVLKRRFVSHLRSKKSFMKKREFGWCMIVYNLTRKLEGSCGFEQMKIDSFFISVWIFY